MTDITYLLTIVDRETLLDKATESLFDEISWGYCLSCGSEHDQVEPDAENYECQECGAQSVMGIQNILIQL